MKNAPPVYERFLQFRAVIIQAIALGWKDQAFHEKLVNDPKSALKDAFDYDCPFDINMVSNPDNAEWKPEFLTDWQVYKLNDLKMVLPPKPKNKEDKALALADYNTKHLTFLTD